MSDDAASEGQRQEGNILYKAGKFEEGTVLLQALMRLAMKALANLLTALKCYRKANELTPDDPAPLSNISSALFELGDYADCITIIDETLPLLSDVAKRNKLLLRKAKSHVYLNELETAHAIFSNAVDAGEMTKCVAGQIAGRGRDEDLWRMHKKMLDLPRFKPML